jgi:sterol 24-C-methyltransferase
MMDKPGLIGAMRTWLPQERVRTVVDEYTSIHAGKLDDRKASYMAMVNNYYDLVTDAFEFGWGQSFHFAPRRKGESLDASIKRHELFLADVLALKPGMKVLDVGCGVGGPMRVIAGASGANIVGVNNSAYQVARGIKYNATAKLDTLCSYLKADFMSIPVPDQSFDAVYAIEATCHAPDKTRLFREIFRVMKPGSQFAGYEWCLTPLYDPGNPEHRDMKKDIEEGTSLPDIWFGDDVVAALKAAGFSIIAARDIADTADPETPWWLPLSGRFSISGFPHTAPGRWLTNKTVNLLETAGLAPKGSTAVSTFLHKGAVALAKGGKTGIFTPMFFFHARKPVAASA